MMRKYFIYTLVILLFPLLGTSCDSNDDPIETEPEVPVDPIDATNEIKLVINVTSNNNIASFYIQGEELSINWGDGKTSTQADIDENYFIQHKYADNKEYVIKIKSKKVIHQFKNFSATNIFDFKEEEIPTFKSITIGRDIEISKLYIQTSNVKEISFGNDNGFRSAEILLGANDWNLSQLKGNELQIYSKERNLLDINDLNTRELSVHVEGKLATLIIDNCNNLTNLAIIGKGGSRQHVENINILNLSKLNKLQVFNLQGSTVSLNNLTTLHETIISGIDFEVIDMDKTNSSADNSSFEGTHLHVSKSILWGDSFVEVKIDNEKAKFVSDIPVLDFSKCEKLRFLDIRGLKDLEQIKLGENNYRLNDIFLLNLPKLKTIDFSACVNLMEVVSQDLTALETVKLSSASKRLESLWFQKANFTEENFITMINSLPNTPLSETPTVNKRFLNIRDNQFNLSNGDKAAKAIAKLDHWSILID